MAGIKTDNDEVVAEIRKILSEAGPLQSRDAAQLQMLELSNTFKFRWAVRICVIGAVFLLLNVFPHPEVYLLQRLFWLCVFLAGFLMAGRYLHCREKNQGPLIDFPWKVASRLQKSQTTEKFSLKRVI